MERAPVIRVYRNSLRWFVWSMTTEDFLTTAKLARLFIQPVMPVSCVYYIEHHVYTMRGLLSIGSQDKWDPTKRQCLIKTWFSSVSSPLWFCLTNTIFKWCFCSSIWSIIITIYIKTNHLIDKLIIIWK